MADALYRLASRLERVEKNIKALSTPQLAHSSVEGGGAVDVNDEDGNTVMQLGGQFDGTYVASTLAGPTPPQPSTPILEPAPGAVIVRWDGTFTDAESAPMDFARVEVHASTEEGFVPDLASTLRGTIETPRGAEVAILLPDQVHYFKFVTRSLAGSFGPSSDEAAETPATIEGGGNSTTFSYDPPGSTANAVGDVWYQKSPSDQIIGQWEGQGGTSWLQTTIGGATLAVDALDGKVITGALVRTEADGERWELTGTGANKGLRGYSGLSDETAPGGIETTVVAGDLSGSQGALRLFAPQRTSAAEYRPSELTLNSGGSIQNEEGSGGGSTSEIVASSNSVRLDGSDSVSIQARGDSGATGSAVLTAAAMDFDLGSAINAVAYHRTSEASASLSLDPSKAVLQAATDYTSTPTAFTVLPDQSARLTNGSLIVGESSEDAERSVRMYRNRTGGSYESRSYLTGGGGSSSSHAIILRRDGVEQNRFQLEESRASLTKPLYVNGVTLHAEPYSYKVLDTGNTFPNAAWTKATGFVDNGGTSGVGFSSDRWTIQKAGRYVLSSTISFRNNTTGMRGVGIRLNGTGIGDVMANAANQYQTTVANSMEYRLEVGDYLEIWAYQSSGSTSIYLLSGPIYGGTVVRWIGS